MTPLDCARRYAARGWRIFPCGADKHPYTRSGFRDASADPEQIARWWSAHPAALIGFWPGASDIAVLDVDMKNGKNGLATLGRLDCQILPATPTIHTPSGGLHLHFQMPEKRIGATIGARGRGIGDGLDWRGDTGYCILPSPGSGYRWGKWHYGNCAPDTVPESLMPREPERPAVTAVPNRPTNGLSRYGEAALDSAARAIINAPGGEQEATLNSECFGIGGLAAAGAIPPEFARKVLLWAARQMRDHDAKRPWHLGELEFKVARSFADGMRHPRDGRRAA